MKLVNKKAQFDYAISEKIEAGIILSGSEVKAVRAKKVDFSGAYVRPLGGEMYVLNLHIGADELPDTRRTRKLLLHKKEILKIQMKVKTLKLTLIPLSLYTSGRLVKCEIALAKGKKNYEKRSQAKQKDILRDLEMELNPKER